MVCSFSLLHSTGVGWALWRTSYIVEMSIEIDDDAGPWFFCAFHRPGRESIYRRVDGPPAPSRWCGRSYFARPHPAAAADSQQSVWQMLSWLCVCCLSLTYSSQRVLIIIDTFYTRLRLSAASLCIGEHRTGSSPVPVGIISVSFYHHHCCVILERLHTQSVSWLLLLDIFPPHFLFLSFIQPAGGGPVENSKLFFLSMTR